MPSSESEKSSQSPSNVLEKKSIIWCFPSSSSSPSVSEASYSKSSYSSASQGKRVKNHERFSPHLSSFGSLDNSDSVFGYTSSEGRLDAENPMNTKKRIKEKIHKVTKVGAGETSSSPGEHDHRHHRRHLTRKSCGDERQTGIKLEVRESARQKELERKHRRVSSSTAERLREEAMAKANEVAQAAVREEQRQQEEEEEWGRLQSQLCELHQQVNRDIDLLHHKVENNEKKWSRAKGETNPFSQRDSNNHNKRSHFSFHSPAARHHHHHHRRPHRTSTGHRKKTSRNITSTRLTPLPPAPSCSSVHSQCVEDARHSCTSRGGASTTGPGASSSSSTTAATPAIGDIPLDVLHEVKKGAREQMEALQHSVVALERATRQVKKMKAARRKREMALEAERMEQERLEKRAGKRESAVILAQAQQLLEVEAEERELRKKLREDGRENARQLAQLQTLMLGLRRELKEAESANNLAEDTAAYEWMLSLRKTEEDTRAYKLQMESLEAGVITPRDQQMEEESAKAWQQSMAEATMQETEKRRDLMRQLYNLPTPSTSSSDRRSSSSRNKKREKKKKKNTKEEKFVGNDKEDMGMPVPPPSFFNTFPGYPFPLPSAAAPAAALSLTPMITMMGGVGGSWGGGEVCPPCALPFPGAYPPPPLGSLPPNALASGYPPSWNTALGDPSVHMNVKMNNSNEGSRGPLHCGAGGGLGTRLRKGKGNHRRRASTSSSCTSSVHSFSVSGSTSLTTTIRTHPCTHSWSEFCSPSSSSSFSLSPSLSLESFCEEVNGSLGKKEREKEKKRRRQREVQKKKRREEKRRRRRKIEEKKRRRNERRKKKSIVNQMEHGFDGENAKRGIGRRPRTTTGGVVTTAPASIPLTPMTGFPPPSFLPPLSQKFPSPEDPSSDVTFPISPAAAGVMRMQQREEEKKEEAFLPSGNGGSWNVCQGRGETTTAPRTSSFPSYFSQGGECPSLPRAPGVAGPYPTIPWTSPCSPPTPPPRPCRSASFPLPPVKGGSSSGGGGGSSIKKPAGRNTEPLYPLHEKAVCAPSSPSRSLPIVRIPPLCSSSSSSSSPGFLSPPMMNPASQLGKDLMAFYPGATELRSAHPHDHHRHRHSNNADDDRLPMVNPYQFPVESLFPSPPSSPPCSPSTTTGGISSLSLVPLDGEEGQDGRGEGRARDGRNCNTSGGSPPYGCRLADHNEHLSVPPPHSSSISNLSSPPGINTGILSSVISFPSSIPFDYHAGMSPVRTKELENEEDKLRKSLWNLTYGVEQVELSSYLQGPPGHTYYYSLPKREDLFDLDPFLHRSSSPSSSSSSSSSRPPPPLPPPSSFFEPPQGVTKHHLYHSPPWVSRRKNGAVPPQKDGEKGKSTAMVEEEGNPKKKKKKKAREGEGHYHDDYSSSGLKSSSMTHCPAGSTSALALVRYMQQHLFEKKQEKKKHQEMKKHRKEVKKHQHHRGQQNAESFDAYDDDDEKEKAEDEKTSYSEREISTSTEKSCSGTSMSGDKEREEEKGRKERGFGPGSHHHSQHHPSPPPCRRRRRLTRRSSQSLPAEKYQKEPKSPSQNRRRSLSSRPGPSSAGSSIRTPSPSFVRTKDRHSRRRSGTSGDCRRRPLLHHRRASSSSQRRSFHLLKENKANSHSEETLFPEEAKVCMMASLLQEVSSAQSELVQLRQDKQKQQQVTSSTLEAIRAEREHFYDLLEKEKDAERKEGEKRRQPPPPPTTTRHRHRSHHHQDGKERKKEQEQAEEQEHEKGDTLPSFRSLSSSVAQRKTQWDEKEDSFLTCTSTPLKESPLKDGEE